jgi:hypothetical protein
MRTFGRLTVIAATSLALAIGSAGLATAGSGATAPYDRRDEASITLTDAQRSAVLAARSAYLTTAAGIRTTYRDAVEGILDTAQAATAPTLLAYALAKDAYAFTRLTGGDATTAKSAFDAARAAYRTALESARAVAKPQLDAAKATARDALAKAGTDYVAAVNAAVPNAPRALLVPPGRGKSWISHGFGKDFGMGWDRLARR